MSQRNSDYQRKAGDLYETPEWVTQALVSFIPNRVKTIWEPACGSGKISNVLKNSQFKVLESDISHGQDFLNFTKYSYGTDTMKVLQAIITNPPFSLATKFIEHSLDLMEPYQGMVAMLLKTDFDHAKTRRHLFGNCPQFSRKVVLTKRIVWFERADGKKAAPSENHSWFIWDFNHKGPPILSYWYEDQLIH